MTRGPLPFLWPLSPLADNEIAQGIGGDLVGKGGGQSGNYLPDAALIPRGAVGGV